MLADEGFGEWGFAALVEADGRRILFDTGANEDTVQRNLKALGLDLSDVELVVLSHNHGDHTTGLLPLRRSSPRVAQGAGDGLRRHAASSGRASAATARSDDRMTRHPARLRSRRRHASSR